MNFVSGIGWVPVSHPVAYAQPYYAPAAPAAVVVLPQARRQRQLYRHVETEVDPRTGRVIGQRVYYDYNPGHFSG